MSDIAAYCRSVETYLCQKNHGHLIRLVGPSFEVVRGWVEQGVPLKVVMRGIDRRVARLAGKGGRPRLLHIEYCEGDVLREFDEWRQAIGPDVHHAGDVASAPAEPVAPRRGPSLPRHLTFVMARLTGLLMAPEPWPGVHAALEACLRALDPITNLAVTARGPARAALLEQLRTLDAALMRTLRESAEAGALEAARAEATRELEPFRERMAAPAFVEALARSLERQLRVKLGVPRVVLE